MAQIQLYAKKQDTGVWTLLDLHASEPIKLNLSVQNIIDPTAATSVFSRTFKVPHTAVNGPFFEGVFNVNSMDFDASKKADAYIMDNGIFYQNGNITLNSIYNNEADNSIEYEITFYGSTSDFGTKIGGGFLNEVDLNKYNHTKDYPNITSSWTGGLFNGDVVYGLIEWGYTYNKDNQPNLPTLSANFAPSSGSLPDAKGSFTNSAYPYMLQQWKPQLRAKALWDKIFEEAGYTYDSAFLDSSLFKNMYIISENISEAILDNSNEFSADNNMIYANVVAATFQWGAPHEISDPGANYNPTTSFYTAPAAGYYEFRIESPTITVFSGGIHLDRHLGWEARLVDNDNNQVLAVNSGVWDIPAYDNEVYFPSGYGFVEALSATLTPGQSVRVDFTTSTVAGGGPIYSGSTQVQFFTQKFSCVVAPNIMSFNAIMPANIRKIDFMKSIINRFRLVFVPSKYQANHFTITPWKDWILQGESKDWTDKLDTSKDMVIKPLFFDQERFQIYKDQEDADYLNYNYQLSYKQTIGQLNLDADNELIKGTKEYKDQFAPTPIAPIGWKQGSGTAPNNIAYNDAAKFLIPHIAKDSQTNDPAQPGKREPIQPKLRLVFYNGLQTAPCTWYMASQSNGTGAIAQTTYPLMSQYSAWPVTSSTYDLNWQNTGVFWDKSVPGLGNGQTNVTTFNTYWKTWYDVTFNPYSRLVEANFVINYGETLDIKFNDYIWVKDAWYFVNEIRDYIVGQKTNCRVQLVKLGNNIGVTVPVVVPPTLPGITATFASTVCDSYCNTISAGATQVTIYINGSNLANSTAAFTDAYGTIPAPVGYYTDASGTFYVTGNGNLSSCVGGINSPCTQINTSTCVCTPVYYTFTVQYSNDQNGCTICCAGGPQQVVYGADPTFQNNNALYTDTLLTQGVQPGFYLQPGPGASALQVGQNNGAVTQLFLCSNCQCTTYYPFSVCFGSTKCDACCCALGTTTIWGTSPTFTSNTKFYFNNSGTSYAGAGYWKNGLKYAQITGVSGDVTSFGNCTGCGCQTGPVSGTINVAVKRGGYTTTTAVQKSFDNGINWVDVATLSITPDDPADTTKSLAFTVEEGVKLRAINSTTTRNGSMRTNYYIGADVYEDTETITPATVTLVIPSLTNQTYTYEFNNNVTGGDNIDYSKFLAVGGYYDQYKSTTGLGSIAGLNPTTASFVSTFDIIGGFNFTNFPTRTKVQSIVSYGNKIYVTGIFNQYKGQSIANRIACLNLDGTLDQTFNTNAGTGLSYVDGSAAYMYSKLWISPSGKLYLTGQGNSYNGVPNNSVSGYLFMRINSNGTRDTSFNNGNYGINDLVTSIQFIGETLYLVGQFTTYGQSGPANGNRIISINENGSINTSFNSGTGFVAFGGINDMVLYDNKMYIAVNDPDTFQYNGVTYAGRIISINPDGTPNSTFNSGITTGFNGQVDAITADATGVYTTGEYSAFNGTASYGITKLGFNASLDSTFNNTTNPFNTGTTDKIELLLSDNALYVWGQFDSYRGTTAHDLIKINKTDGSYITTFDVGQGFNNGANTDKVITLFEVSYITPPTVYQISVSYSNVNGCTAYCNRPYSNTIYGNTVSLATATVLYANSTGSTFAPAGYYSDGGTIVQVDGNGIIIAVIDINTCNCNTLYAFDVTYNADECITCGVGGIPTTETVWGIYSNWSSNTILYADNLGTTFAPVGWYAYNYNITLQVGVNGLVHTIGDCDIDCAPPVECVSLRILNTSGQYNAWSYRTCDGQLEFGEMFPGEVLFTPCIQQGSFQATESYLVQRTLYC